LKLAPTEGGESIVLQVEDEYEDSIGPGWGDPGGVRDLRTTRLGQILAELSGVPVGAEGSRTFEEWTLRALKMLLAGMLSNFELKPDPNAVQQRDIVATNSAPGGFWRRVFDDYHSRQVLFEVKNYEALKAEDYRQVEAYSSGAYGSFAVLIYRSENEGLTEHERSWLMEMWHEKRVLIFTVPVIVLQRCIGRLRNARKHDYTEAALQKRLDTFQRKYLAIRHA
jgi:hypothetical protein